MWASCWDTDSSKRSSDENVPPIASPHAIEEASTIAYEPKLLLRNPTRREAILLSLALGGRGFAGLCLEPVVVSDFCARSDFISLDTANLVISVLLKWRRDGVCSGATTRKLFSLRFDAAGRAVLERGQCRRKLIGGSNCSVVFCCNCLNRQPLHAASKAVLFRLYAASNFRPRPFEKTCYLTPPIGGCVYFLNRLHLLFSL